jgi:hypothetical protein
VQLIVEMWVHADARVQLELIPDVKMMKRLEKQALMSMFVTLVVVPLFPLAIIALWNMLKPRRAFTGALKDEFPNRTSSGGTSEKLEKGEKKPNSKLTTAYVDSIRIEKDASGDFSIQCGPPTPQTFVSTYRTAQFYFSGDRNPSSL